MTLLELEQSLPNGLHDAELCCCTVNYLERKVVLDLSIWVGSLDDPPERREAYRRAKLSILGLLFLSIEPPDSRYPFTTANFLRIDSCDRSGDLDQRLIKALPDGAFVRSLFVAEWNSFIDLAGMNTTLDWAGETEINGKTGGRHWLPGETII